MRTKCIFCGGTAMIADGRLDHNRTCETQEARVRLQAAKELAFELQEQKRIAK